MEHRFRGPDGAEKVLYMHNSEDPKARRAEEVEGGSDSGGGGIVRSFQLVFSSVRSVQDIFKAMLATETEMDCLDTVRAYLTPVRCGGRAARTTCPRSFRLE